MINPEFLKEIARLQNIHDESFAKVGYYRCYDGCPDTALQAKYDIENLIMQEIKKKEPRAHITFFPVENSYQVHVWGKDIGKMFASKKDTLMSALEELSR